MAILDRPMFQRPLTKDQLRMYGIPAFANGGIVQNFKNGGPAEKLDIASDEELTQLGIKIDPKYEYYYKDGKLFRRLKADPAETSPEDLITLQREGDVYLGEGSPLRPFGPDVSKGADVKEELVKAQQEEVKDIATPVPDDIRKATTTDQLAKALLEQDDAPGTSKAIQDKVTNIQSDMGDDQRDQLSQLEGLVRERSDLYKKILGDPKEGLKFQGLLQMAQFGLNLASAKGGTFAEKIAKSAKDPLQTFAALGQEALKDERAIDMLAIKGAEDELGRTQKAGNYGQLVNDLMAQGLDREEANKKAEEIYAQKTGKTLVEQKDERFKEYLKLYEAEFSADEAREKANQAIEQEFGTPMFEVKETIVEIDSDAEFEALEPGTQYRNKGETQVRVK